MSHQMIRFLCQLIAVLTYLAIVSCQFTLPPSCAANETLDSICYECAKTVPGVYLYMYQECCGGNETLYTYCEAVYSVNAQG